MKTPHVTLDKKLRSQLKAVRDPLAALVATAVKNTGAFNLLESESSRLEEQIARLEGTDLTDATAHKLSIKRERLRQVASRLAAAGDRPASDEANAEMVGLLLEFRPLVQRAMRPIYDAVAAEISRAMRPYFGESNVVDQMMPQALPMMQLANFGSRQWGLNVLNPVSQAKDAINIIDSLFSGKSPVQL